VRLDSGGSGGRGGSADFDDEEVGGYRGDAEASEGFGDLAGLLVVSKVS